MKKILSLALLLFLLMGSGAAMAQNKKAPRSKANDKTSQNNAFPVKKEAVTVKSREKHEFFNGTIRYNVVRKKNADRHNSQPQKSNNLSTAVSVNSKQLQVDESKLKEVAPEEMNVLYSYTKEGTYAHFGRFGLAGTKESGTLFFVYADPENPIVAKTNEKEKLELGEESKAYYVRTRETKEIAGCKAVCYECNLPNMKGNIWVDESSVLYVENVPFYGMMHPVLEFDLKIIIEEKEVSSYHLVASEIMPDKVDDDMIGRIRGGNFLELPEVLGRFCEMMGL